MRILEIETFGRGGLTHYTYNLSRALAARGHEVTLMTAAGYELAEHAGPPEGVRLVPAIGRAGHRWAKRLPGPARALLLKGEAVFDAFATAARARRLAPDVVHFHCTNPVALLYMRRLSRLGRALVSTAHVVTPHEPIRFQPAIYRRLHALGDGIVAHSGFDRDRLVNELGVVPERVAVIPHGEYGFFGREVAPTDRAGARARLGLGPEHEVALFFGYIREYKGLDVLLEAWSAVAAARPSARLVVAGDPVRLDRSRRAELEAWAERLGVVHRFAFIPFDEVSTYFAAADVLAMPYRHISQSGVLYLALSMGVPVVATRVGTLPDMLDDGKSALLVPSEAPNELARALGRALGDPALRDRLAAGGKAIAAAHSWPAIAERTEALFTELLEARPPQRPTS